MPPMFTSIRKTAIAILVVSVGTFALLGILSIWEVIGKEDVYKSLTSMGVISFASFLVILVSMEREGKLWQNSAKNVPQFSTGRVVGIAIVLIILLMFFSRFFFSYY